jgi:hypothetical protein
MLEPDGPNHHGEYISVDLTSANIPLLPPGCMFDRHARYLVRSKRDTTLATHTRDPSLWTFHFNVFIHCRLMTDTCSPVGVDIHTSNSDRGRRSQSPSELLIPKNRSTGNLLAHAPKGTEKARIRFSFDAGLAAAEYDTMSRLVIETPPRRGMGMVRSRSRGSSVSEA